MLPSPNEIVDVVHAASAICGCAVKLSASMSAKSNRRYTNASAQSTKMLLLIATTTRILPPLVEVYLPHM
jgi:hypothetical protein